MQPAWTPHSHARLAYAQRVLEAGGIRLSVVTVAQTQGDYGWGNVAREADEILFPGRDYWSIRYRELRRAITRALEASLPEVVVVPGWAFRESLASLGWALRARVRRVLVSDSQRIDAGRRTAKELAKKAVVGAFDSAFVGGIPHVRYLEDLGMDASRCFMGCDVVDNAFFASVERGEADRPPTLLSCVRLLHGKNLDAVIDTLQRHPKPWRWLLAGDGPERNLLERHVRAAGLSARVEFLGHVSYERLTETYARADVYLQPSLSETWGLAVNEAMAAGLPVIVSSRCGCSEDLVTTDNGVVFDPCDPHGLSAALSEMWDRRDSWTTMGEASRVVIGDWGLDRYAAGLEAACRAAVEGPPRGDGALNALLGRVL